jgi:hypothetical protein
LASLSPLRAATTRILRVKEVLEAAGRQANQARQAQRAQARAEELPDLVAQAPGALLAVRRAPPVRLALELVQEPAARAAAARGVAARGVAAQGVCRRPAHPVQEGPADRRGPICLREP